MEYPKIGSTYANERKGIAALQKYAASLGQIWRETNTGDVGIDGMLEHVNDLGYASGRMMAVQVKSGHSYFAHPTESGWKFYPEAKHRSYWSSFPLPVILVLHDPSSDTSYWTDIRQFLRSPNNSEAAYIEVSSKNVLESTNVVELFTTAGAQSEPFIEDLNEVMQVLLNTKSESITFPLSHFELYVLGLTNICRSIYFGMDMVIEAVEFNLASQNSEFGMGLGEYEHEFIFQYIKFLLAQDLATVDFADCLIDYVDRMVTPHFVAPLTIRGRTLVKLIHEREAQLVEAGKLASAGNLHVAQEGFFGMVRPSYLHRFTRVMQFQALNCD